MEADTTMRDWSKELVEAQMQTGTTWFKAEDGISYEVRFTNDGSPEYTQDFDGKELVKVDFKVVVSGGSYDKTDCIWSVTKGGSDSLWIKLAALFTNNMGAIGYIVNVKAKGDGRQRRYIVKEYNDLTFTE